MGAKTEISWTDATWTPLRARVKSDAGAIAAAKGYNSLVEIGQQMAGHVGPHCERVSHGCDHCYSETNNGRCLPANGTGLPFDRRSRDLVDIFLDEKILIQPMHWKKPRRVFVCSQTDLFGEWITDEIILAVLQTIAKCPSHLFQILTKRIERAVTLLGSRRWRDLGFSQAMGGDFYAALVPGEHRESDSPFLPNVQIGPSIENQEMADKRFGYVCQLGEAGWRTMVSLEPLLGPVAVPERYLNLSGRAWVIIGGESGPGARPFDPEWARSSIRQCRAAGVRVFYKQGGTSNACTHDRKGGHIECFPEDLRVREFPA